MSDASNRVALRPPAPNRIAAQKNTGRRNTVGVWGSPGTSRLVGLCAEREDGNTARDNRQQASFDHPLWQRGQHGSTARDDQHQRRNDAQLGQDVGKHASPPDEPVRFMARGVDDRGVGERREDRCRDAGRDDEGADASQRVKPLRLVAQDTEQAGPDNRLAAVGDEERRNHRQWPAHRALHPEVNGKRAEQTDPPQSNRHEHQRRGEHRVRWPQHGRRRRRKTQRQTESNGDVVPQARRSRRAWQSSAADAGPPASARRSSS